MDIRGRSDLDSKLQYYLDQVIAYDDPLRQSAALEMIPFNDLKKKAAVALAKERNFDPSRPEIEHSVLVQLLYWFKSHFRWVNSPPCIFCESETISIGHGPPSSEDLLYGANRVEVFCCNLCNSITRFPRYNDPLKLMETRRGRCGEWANCFTFCCRVLGYKARLVLDFTDHLWTECFSDLYERWIHLDACEGVYDKPLLYEKGWDKKLTYVIAFANDGVYDVTKRYIKSWEKVLPRRRMVSEADLEESIAFLTAIQRSTLAPEEFERLEYYDKKEMEELQGTRKSDSDSALLVGRQSGSEEWRLARGEIGNQVTSPNSSCPGRRRECVDEHVGLIEEALRSVFSVTDLNQEGRETTAELVDGFVELLTELEAKTCKEKEITLEEGKHKATLLEKAGPLLQALNLQMCGNQISVKDLPVRTWLALPVALELLKGLSEKLHHVTKSKAEIGFWKHLRGAKRICEAADGHSYASGEELPLGIASSAFDGLSSTKWEEPNGAKGAWIVYKVSSSYTVTAYTLTSANDCPERDPYSWVLEGSPDGGETWEYLDSQTGVIFSSRFERRLFETTNEKQGQWNAFRLRFLAVRDPEKTSRLQLARIDFYDETEQLT